MPMHPIDRSPESCRVTVKEWHGHPAKTLPGYKLIYQATWLFNRFQSAFAARLLELQLVNW